jgi:hypothetical protein
LAVKTPHQLFFVKKIDRALDEHRTRNSALRDGKGTQQHRYQISNPRDTRGPFDMGLEQSHLIDVLKGAPPLQDCAGRTTQQDHRRLCELGVLDRGNGVGDPGARRYRRHPGRPGEPGNGVGGKDSVGLVANIDHADSHPFGGDQNGRDVAPTQSEQKSDALLVEDLGDELAAVHPAKSP